VVILTEGGTKSGLGHVTRCCSLYEAFEESGYSALLVINGEPSDHPVITGKNVQFSNWIDNPADKPYFEEGPIVIIDSYLANYECYTRYSDNFDLTISLDDNIRMNYPAGIVLNGAMFAENVEYPKDPGITYLLGAEYTPLRKEFWDVESKKLNSKIQTVLITLGGSDTRNLTGPVVDLMLKSYPDLNLKVIANSEELASSIVEKGENNRIEIIGNVDALMMKEAMLESDLAISAGGQTLYELARMGVPTIVIEVIYNQRDNVLGWSKAGFIDNSVKWDDEKFEQLILERMSVLLDPGIRQNRSDIGQKLMDGQGARRVSKRCIELITSR